MGHEPVGPLIDSWHMSIVDMIVLHLEHHHIASPGLQWLKFLSPDINLYKYLLIKEQPQMLMAGCSSGERRRKLNEVLHLKNIEFYDG